MGKPGAAGNSNAGKSLQQNASGTRENPDQSRESTRAAATPKQQARQAVQGVARELERARQKDKSQNGEHAFALGQSTPKQDQHLDAQQRAMLHAVPDDPGALLRRKFRLEWEQRNGQQQEDGQP